MKKIILLPKTLFLLLFLILNNGCNDLDDNLKTEIIQKSNESTFKKDSELIKLIDRVVSKTHNSSTEIVCLDFIYPFTLLIYDTNLDIIGNRILIGDSDFSEFLGGLNPDQAISISYPIRTTLSDGTIFSVNNNIELKVALESCTNEDIIEYYSNLFGGNGQNKCVWKVPYKENFNNKYSSGVFEAKNDGTIKFSFDNLIYNGTWSFLFVNNEFQMNINLEGTSNVAQDWNISRKIIYGNNPTGETITIEDSLNNIILEQACEKTLIYQLGAIGPAGGLVFYDKGFYSFGWRYLEAAPIDLGFFEWGCKGSFIQNTKADIGNGLLNSAKITNYHDGLLTYYSNPSICNSLNNGTVVARNVFFYTNQDFQDWYLPSEKELNLMYLNLKIQNLGNFTNNTYWSSTEIDVNFAKTINFNSGNIISTSKIPVINIIKARPIRSF